MRRVLVPLVAVLLLVPAMPAQGVESPLRGPLIGDSDENSDESSSSDDALPSSPEEPSGDLTPDVDLPGTPEDSDADPSDPPGVSADSEDTSDGGDTPDGDDPAVEEPGDREEHKKLPQGPPADGEPGPGREWGLSAGSLTLQGSRFHGIEEEEVDGETVRTLHFTAERLEIEDLRQRAQAGNGRQLEVASAPGATSTISGPVDMKVRELSGTLRAGEFPLVPLTLSADSFLLPDVDLSFLRLPTLTFDDATVDNVDLRGEELNIPGATIKLLDE